MFYLHGDHLTLHVLTHSFPTRRSSDLDLVVLDITLPGRSGFDILKGLRRRSDSTPVLVLTARSEVDDRVSALDLGADDYLVKPFDFREFEARCRALLRRRQGIAGNVSRYGNMVRSEEHTSELQSLMRHSYAVFCLKKKKKKRSRR